MLKAILHGKAGRIEHNKDESVSWSSLFKTHEDLLTSTIFERFAYLSDKLQHTLLMHWFKQHHGIIPASFGQFSHITYWQRFNHEHGEGTNQVEPDLIIHFDKCNILVEIKPPAGGNQYFGQWLKEIESFLQAEDYNHKPLYFLAIGKVKTELAQQWAEQLLPKIDQLECVAALNWDVLTAHLVKLVSESSSYELLKQDRRVVQDMLEGLSLYGEQTSPFLWSDLLNNTLPPISLNHPQLINHPTPLTHQPDSKVRT
jgi:hypothetical protein